MGVGARELATIDAALTVNLLWLEALPFCILVGEETVTRAEAVAELERLRDPDAMTARLPPELREAAREEWEELLGAPYSPVPDLEAALELEWAEVELTEEARVLEYERAVERIAERAERARAEREPGGEGDGG